MPRKKNWKRSEALKKRVLQDKNEDESTVKEVHEIISKDVEFNTVMHLKDCQYNQTGNELNPTVSVQGSFHQGDPQFLNNSGRQCVANALVSVIFSNIKDICSWDKYDLDTILRSGNELYGYLQNSTTINHELLLVTELPQILDIFDTQFTLSIGEPLFGIIGKVAVETDFFMSFDNALNVSLREYNACFVIFGGAAFAVIKKDSIYWVFDSHSRNSKGMVMPDGASVLIMFNSVKEVHEHCCNLALSMHAIENEQFEVTGISANVDCHTGGNNETLSEDDVQVIASEHTPLLYCPLTLELRESLCTVLNIQNEDKTEYIHSRLNMEMGEPCKTKTIKEDGNCFFRALSYALSGTENNHRKIRLAIVKHLKDNPTAFRSCLRSDYDSVENYLLASRMKYLTTWATEVEILAAADLLRTDIYTFTRDKWLKYSNHQIHNNALNSGKAIYLKHCLNIHYEFVECVKQLGVETCGCTHNVGMTYCSMEFESQVRQRRGTKRNYILAQCEQWKTKKEESPLPIIIPDHLKHRTKRIKQYVAKRRKLDKEKERYHNDTDIKQYDENEYHKKNIKARVTLSRKLSANKQQNMESVTSLFRNEVCNGPEYVCSVCHRQLFRNQVILCKREIYSTKENKVTRVAEKCITDDYLHKCTSICADNCVYMRTGKTELWICFTCHRKILKGRMPAEASVNNLHLQRIPQKLNCLNSLEQHLIGLHIPFMKMLALPKGGQNGVHGPVVCVPSSIDKTTSILPRSGPDDQMIQVKLKRKLTYKGHYQYQFVNDSHIKNALRYLKMNNKWYNNVEYNTDWTNPLSRIDEENEGNEQDNTSNLTETESQLQDDDCEKEQQGMFIDTCLQPVDIAQDVFDQHCGNISCVAPAEGNSPVKMLMDESNEAKSFPVLYPTGSPTFHDKRDEKITLSRYLNTRLMNADGRFARNTDFIFYAQYLSEVQQVVSNVSIALRKGSTKSCSKTITASTLIDTQSLKDILKNDEGYKFMKPIRGTPPFWQSAQKDLFAMLRQLGIPTWFCSFSSADMRWPEMIESILNERGDYCKTEELDWSEKCAILRNNPVTAARMFEHRFHCFLKRVILSPAEPIGKIEDYFYRVEFQQRGSPHTHCLFWVKDAPIIDKDEDHKVTEFVDKYISCEIPSSEQDEELFDIVNSVQKHSMRHSKTCRKQGTTCRFNFPRPPSEKTFISRIDESESNDDHESENIENDVVQPEYTDDDDDEVEGNNHQGSVGKLMTNDAAKAILTKIWNELSNTDNNFTTVDSLFTSIALSQELFERAYSTLTKKTSIVLKRQPNDVWVNQYNKDLLRCWNANMDIQFVVDAYSCIVYIISYISKAEKEMGLLLDHAQREASEEGNVDAKLAMKKLGGVYLNNRELGAQEAVYRVCNLKLKEGSRKVQFIPTGENPVKMSLPLEILQNKCKTGNLNNEDIWMTSMVDRYRNRPIEERFDIMCLATFVSEYRVLSNSEVSNMGNARNRVIKLNNGLGYVLRRTRTEPAVIRYARFSLTKHPEKYYQSILQLFLPYRTDFQLKPESFKSFEEFYQTGAVKCGCSALETVKVIVDRNKAMFEREADVIDAAERLLEKHPSLEDAWAQIHPESELERLECLGKAKDNSESDEEESVECIPDLLEKDKNVCSTEVYHHCGISRDEAKILLRSLNDRQCDIFYTVRKWCLSKCNGIHVEPFHMFLSGGAGTGKSHLIKAIYYEASRILAHTVPRPDDISVLLTAPTGVAAFNIDALTIHSTFAIAVDAKLPYQPLGEEKINTIRSKLANLQILIIDEISMVDKRLLVYVHGRLRQIKQTGDYSPFGNVSVIAVGDFYQLAPVKGKALFVENQGIDLWNDYFSIAELTHIVRQQDSKFAETLNNIRTRQKSDEMLTSDVNMLRCRETGEECDGIYIFATNKEVDKCNVEKLHSLCSDPICIRAQDFSRNHKSKKLERKDTLYVKVYNTNLAKTVTLAVGARVMLIKNIDVSDGLVNGVFGTVSYISLNPGEIFPSKIFVVFDNKKVGIKLRSQSESFSSLPENSTQINPQEDRVNNGGGIRRQFPLKLAWACTVHKVQGLTVEKATVSLGKIFSPGQAYVALSRVKTLNGLVIKEFKESALYCNDKIKDAMITMPKFITFTDEGSDSVCSYSFMLHNIEGLYSHIEDLKFDKRFLKADIICLTETWLPNANPPSVLQLDNFRFHHQPRSLCYDTSDKLTAELKEQAHGGVGVYYSFHRCIEFLDLSISNLEYLAFHVNDANMKVAVVYRPRSYKADVFRRNLLTLATEMDKIPGGTIIMGDFNENLFVSSSVRKLLEDKGYKQCVTEATTESGTLIDHVYVKRIDIVSADVVQTHFGFHEAICLKL
ncbi:uncharacterized protein LOC100378309, partial [Saccoglossus kowalevskii]|uniref:ATP-dependent DNA helicase n=1 Tax=Saccoglossus kowalevskii TaxID=10224 RepID=A0ABM0GMJ9_SACKO